MVVNVRTDRTQYYYQVLRILQNLPAYSKLKEKEIQVLSQLLAFREKFMLEQRMTDESMVGELLLSKSVRREVCKSLEITDANFRNYLSFLRTKGFIVGDRIDLKYPISYLNEIVFNFVEQKTETNGSTGKEG